MTDVNVLVRVPVVYLLVQKFAEMMEEFGQISVLFLDSYHEQVKLRAKISKI